MADEERLESLRAIVREVVREELKPLLVLVDVEQRPVSSTAKIAAVVNFLFGLLYLVFEIAKSTHR